MTPPAQETVQEARISMPLPRLLRLPSALLALLLALVGAALLTPQTAQAGTITIVDGPNTPPAGGVVTDGYIQAQLATGDLTIDTSAGSGPDEIRVLSGAVINWTSGRTLTLDADASIIISGTIQHDGPASGAGGLTLLALNGTVYVGPGDQTAGVAAGSRFGLTRLIAEHLMLQGGSVIESYAQLGFRAINQGATYSVTGPISVTVSLDISATAGTTANYTYVQIGHGGTSSSINGSPSGNFTGAITVEVVGDVTFQGGHTYSYAQLGNGGYLNRGDHGGNHSLNAGGNVSFLAGDNIAYAHLGNGGYTASAALSGNHTLIAGGDVLFAAGEDAGAYAQFGNGGYGTGGAHRGNHFLDAVGAVTFLGGNATGVYAQLGNGGQSAGGDYGGNHTLDAGGPILFQGGNNAGNYVQLGNGGIGAIGDHAGDLSLTGATSVAFLGGVGINAYAQFGNGGNGADGVDAGAITLANSGNLTVTAGSGADAYAMIGHGSDVRTNASGQATGSRSGDIMLQVGETAVFSGSQVGHLSADGPITVTQGNTFLGVSQNDPSFETGPGQLLVTGAISTNFSSAPDANGGELRIYIPRETSQQIPTTASFNGETFVTANTIPPDRLEGFHAFGEGPYAPPYSFYLGPKTGPDVRITKDFAPADPVRPGGALTYTLSFSNTGTVTATGVVVSDSLSSVLTGTVVTLSPDSGVVITETSAAPNLVWTVSDLAPGQGGAIELAVTIIESAEPGSLSNTATITATDDLEPGNNRATVTSEIAPDADLFLPVLLRESE